MSRLASGRVYLPSRPPFAYGPASIFREDATKLTVSESQEFKEKFANQAYYGNEAQTGKFFGYEGMGYGGFAHECQIVWNEFTVPLYIVTPDTPRVPVICVKEEGAEETPRAPGALSNIQSFFEEVPMPNPAELPLGEISPAGTDKSIVVYRPATDEMWEMHRLSRFALGAHMGEWKFTAGAYISPVSESNGIPPNKWGVSASGLGILGGNIGLDDLVRVQRGEGLGHALACAVPVRLNEHLAPAVRNDTGENKHKFMADGKTANPAYGMVDGVPEGLWMRFPPASRASEYAMTGKLEVAIYEAIREHGLVVRDGGGLVTFYLHDPRTLESPYRETPVNALAECTSIEGVAAYVKASAGMTDPTLPTFDEILHGAGSVFDRMPWRSLEQLAARES